MEFLTIHDQMKKGAKTDTYTGRKRQTDNQPFYADSADSYNSWKDFALAGLRSYFEK